MDYEAGYAEDYEADYEADYAVGYEVDYKVAKGAVSYGDRGRQRCWRLRRRRGRRRRRAVESRRVAADWKGRRKRAGRWSWFSSPACDRGDRGSGFRGRPRTGGATRFLEMRKGVG